MGHRHDKQPNNSTTLTNNVVHGAIAFIGGAGSVGVLC